MEKKKYKRNKRIELSKNIANYNAKEMWYKTN